MTAQRFLRSVGRWLTRHPRAGSCGKGAEARMNQGGSFDRFTERARHVMQLAQEEAQRLQHHYIGTEHLLLGLLGEEEGVAGKVLTGLGVDLERARQAVEGIVGRGEHLVSGEVGLTPRAKHVVELAVDEARRLHHHYLGTEHLLLGLLREGEGIGAGVLERFGLSLQEVRANIIQVLHQQGRPPLVCSFCRKQQDQAQRRRFGLFRFEKDARCASLLQPVHAREEQRTPKSTPLVGRTRPDHPDFADGVFAAAVRYPGEFTETKRRKRSGGIDRDHIQVGLVGGGLVIVESHPDPVKHCPVQFLVLLQLLPIHATTQDKACWQVSHWQGDFERANQAQILCRKRSETCPLQERAAFRFAFVTTAPQGEGFPALSRLLLRPRDGPGENLRFEAAATRLWMHLEGQDSRGRRYEGVGHGRAICLHPEHGCLLGPRPPVEVSNDSSLLVLPRRPFRSRTLRERREERAQFRESRGIVPVLGCRAGPLQLKDALQVCCPRIGAHVYRHLLLLSTGLRSAIKGWDASLAPGRVTRTPAYGWLVSRACRSPRCVHLPGPQWYRHPLLKTGIRFGDVFSKDDEVPRGISHGELLETPGFGLQGSLARFGRQILLIQGINVGGSDPTDRVFPRWEVLEVVQVQRHLVPFDDGKILVVIRGLKAQLLIEGQRLLQIADNKTRSNPKKSWLATL